MPGPPKQPEAPLSEEEEEEEEEEKREEVAEAPAETAGFLYHGQDLDAIDESTKHSVTKVLIHSDVTEIQDQAFHNWTQLRHVEFLSPSHVTTIGSGAFHQTASLKTIEVPASVTSIGGVSSFDPNDSLTEVTFAPGSQLQTIGEDAFHQCTALSKIEIPDSVTSIGEKAFFGNTALKEVIFTANSKLETIGEDAFYDCRALTGITVPATVRSIGEKAFFGNTSLNTVRFASNSNLQVIGNFAFYECQGLKTIELPASVRSIGQEAFSRNEQLNAVIFPSESKLESIGEGAFFECTALTKILVPASVKSIGKEAFSWNGNLKEVTFAPSARLECIGEGAFYQCTALERIKVPAAVKIIGKEAFCGNKSLQKVDVLAMVPGRIPNGHALSIGDGAFMNCDSLRSVKLGESTKSIGANCFWRCNKLQHFEMGCPETVSISQRIFEGCNSIETIKVPTPTSIEISFVKTNSTELSSSERSNDYSHRYGQKFLSKFLYTAFAADILEWLLVRSQRRTLLSLKSLKWIEFELLVQKVKGSKKLVSLVSQLQANRRVVFLFMFDVYMNVGLFLVFSFAANSFFESTPNLVLNIWSIVFAIYFALREFFQLRYEGWMYLSNFWNCFDMARISLVFASCIIMMLHDDSDTIPNTTRYVLLWTGVSVTLGVILFLRNAFLPNAEFVGGLIEVSWKLWPFIIVASLMVVAFGYSFFALRLTSSDCGAGDEDSPCNFFESIMVSFAFLFGGPDLTGSRGFDLAFGFAVVVVLLNVLIAVVSDAWAESSERGADIFFRYRIAFLAEVESLFCMLDNTGWQKWWCHPCKASQPTGVPHTASEEYLDLSLMEYLDSRKIGDGIPWDEFPYSTVKDDPFKYMGATLMKLPKSKLEFLLKQKRSFSELDMEKLQHMGSFERDWYWIGKSKETVGDSEELFRPKVTRVRLVMYCIIYVVFLSLGLFTFGLLWPRRVREDLFSIQFSERESEADKTEMMKQLESDMKERLGTIEKNMKAIEAKLEVAIEKNLKAVDSKFDLILKELKAMKEK